MNFFVLINFIAHFLCQFHFREWNHAWNFTKLLLSLSFFLRFDFVYFFESIRNCFWFFFWHMKDRIFGASNVIIDSESDSFFSASYFLRMSWTRRKIKQIDKKKEIINQRDSINIKLMLKWQNENTKKK